MNRLFCLLAFSAVCSLPLFAQIPPPPQPPSKPMAQFDGSKIQPATLRFSTKVSMMGQELSVNSTRSVSMSLLDGKPVWRVVESASGPMGTISDTTDLDAKTLLPLRRSAAQGGGELFLAFKDGSVEGRMAGGGSEVPISIKVERPVLSDGAGSELAISTLPLVEGYAATLYGLDILKGTAKEMSLKVLGIEPVTVSAGSFVAFKVELRSADSSGTIVTLWFNKEDRRTVRVETKLPAQMGDGVSVTELQK